MEDFNALGNIQYGEDYVLFSISPEIYNLNVIRSAALDFFDRACIILDGNPRYEILVELRPKGDFLLKDLVEEFSQLLLKKSVQDVNRKI